VDAAEPPAPEPGPLGTTGPSPDRFLRRAAVLADRDRARFLQFLAHEIRNPLASALWSVEMLNRRPPGDARGARVASLAARSLRRLRALVEDLLAIERLPAVPAAGRVDVLEAVEKALGPHELEPEGVAAPVAGPSGLVAALDPVLFEKLVHAAVRRARRAGDGGAIRIAVRHEGASALVEIHREGAEARVVDPPVLTSGGGEGSGTTFALYYARVAALSLRIALWVESRPGGCAILVRVPLESPAPH
jgi:signal transduction histidine kinase